MMACCFGRSSDPDEKKSKDIDQMIHRDQKLMQKQVKLLLLGTQSLPFDTGFPLTQW